MSTPSNSQGRVARARILVVEDEEPLARLVASYLLRDGYDAELIDADSSTRIPIAKQLPKLIESARPHAQDLGCESELDHLLDIDFRTGAQRQREIVRAGASLTELVGSLAQQFA